MTAPTASVGSAVGFALMPTGTAWERMPWHAVQKAAWETLTEAAHYRAPPCRSRCTQVTLSSPPGPRLASRRSARLPATIPTEVLMRLIGLVPSLLSIAVVPAIH